VKFLLTDDASQYFRLLEVKTVRGIGQQMFANFRMLNFELYSAATGQIPLLMI